MVLLRAGGGLLGVAGFDGVAVLEEEAAALVAAVAVQEEDRPRVRKKRTMTLRQT